MVIQEEFSITVTLILEPDMDGLKGNLWNTGSVKKQGTLRGKKDCHWQWKIRTTNRNTNDDYNTSKQPEYQKRYVL
jgi:hypothetical protein